MDHENLSGTIPTLSPTLTLVRRALVSKVSLPLKEGKVPIGCSDPGALHKMLSGGRTVKDTRVGHKRSLQENYTAVVLKSAKN